MRGKDSTKGRGSMNEKGSMTVGGSRREGNSIEVRGSILQHRHEDFMHLAACK